MRIVTEHDAVNVPRQRDVVRVSAENHGFPVSDVFEKLLAVRGVACRVGPSDAAQRVSVAAGDDAARGRSPSGSGRATLR